MQLKSCIPSAEVFNIIETNYRCKYKDHLRIAQE